MTLVNNMEILVVPAGIVLSFALFAADGMALAEPVDRAAHLCLLSKFFWGGTLIHSFRSEMSHRNKTPGGMNV